MFILTFLRVQKKHFINVKIVTLYFFLNKYKYLTHISLQNKVLVVSILLKNNILDLNFPVSELYKKYFLQSLHTDIIIYYTNS